MANTDLSDDTVEKIRNHRDDLEAVAESDLPVNWVADALLTIADADGGDGPA